MLGVSRVGSLASSYAPPNYHLIFSDSFSGTALNTKYWNTYIASKGSNGWPWNATDAQASSGSGMGANGSDTAWYMPGSVHVANGLTLTAQRRVTHTGYAWTSGLVSTYGKFAMNGGYLQVRMKVGGASGLWPTIWLLPASTAPTTTDNYEIDVQEGGFLSGSISPLAIMASHEHNPTNLCSSLANTKRNLADGNYHTYGLNWVPGQSEAFYIDGVMMAKFTTPTCNIANEPMELLLNLAIAAPSTASWHTPVRSTTPSPDTMQIASVQVYKP